jgi:crossover junction endodeoxyribonuclease RuvC
MTILGVDPGTLITGFGVIESRNGKTKILTSGIIKNSGDVSMPRRLKKIFETLTEIIEKYRPDENAIETAFYGKNAQSALKLGQARGVAMLAAVIREIPTYEYSPREVKKAIVGNGAAAKEQVKFMIQSLLNLKQVPKEYDITDALAVALCHLHRRQSPGHPTFTNWKGYLAAHPEKIKSQRRITMR